MRKTRPWETDWIVISSEEATGQATLFVYFQSCFENIHTSGSHEMVQANSGKKPKLERGIWSTKTVSKH